MGVLLPPTGVMKNVCLVKRSTRMGNQGAKLTSEPKLPEKAHVDESQEEERKHTMLLVIVTSSWETNFLVGALLLALLSDVDAHTSDAIGFFLEKPPIDRSIERWERFNRTNFVNFARSGRFAIIIIIAVVVIVASVIITTIVAVVVLLLVGIFVRILFLLLISNSRIPAQSCRLSRCGGGGTTA